MRLTAAENPETIKRYGHIKPGPKWGSARCSARYPGSARPCTREKDHRGPHVAHGRFKKVVAVWEAETEARGAGAITRMDPASGALSTVGAAWRAVVRNAPSMEDAFLLILFLGMVAFVIDWALMILGR